MKKPKNIANLLHSEDWLSVWLGAVIIILGSIAVLTGWFDFSVMKFSTWTAGEILSDKDAAKVVPLVQQLSSWAFWQKTITTILVLGVLFGIGVKLQGEKLRKFLPAFLLLFAIAVIVRLISAEFTLKRYLEWAFWALLIGLFISNTVGVPKWLKPAIRTEFYIKTGLVVFGFSVLFSNIAKFGLYGLGIAWGVTPIVMLFMWWFGNRVLKITNKPLLITLSAATSVCGTSAAIATGAASGVKKEDLSVAISISIIFTIVMMIFEPMIIEWSGMSQIMGGALIGGTVDSTGAVVLAGNALGPEAEQVASLVKMIQNILIGFIAFFVAVFFSKSVDNSGKSSVGASEIWTRFPKFILGFMVASVVASIIFVPAFGAEKTNAVNKVLGGYKDWAFVLAFTSIGLDTDFKQIAKSMQGGKVLWLYIIGQTFNILLTFVVVWLLLSGHIFPTPDIKTFNDKEEKVMEKREIRAIRKEAKEEGHSISLKEAKEMVKKEAEPAAVTNE